VNKADTAWDFTDLEILNRFCYSDSISGSVLPFPEKIQMIPEKRTETCVDDESSLQEADLEYILDDGDSEKISNCEVGAAANLCDNTQDELVREGIHIDNQTLTTFHDHCKLTCDFCTPKDIEYYMITVNTVKAIFAEDQNGDGIPVRVTINGAAETHIDFQPDSIRQQVPFDKKIKFHCGDRIQFAAIPQGADGDVICDVRMVDEDTSAARMAEASSEVIIGGDIEVTFDCYTPEGRR